MLIKRYPNRKLYDTAARRYITLPDVAEILRRGEDVQVVDHATGEDITAATLAQVISGQEKLHRGQLPGDLLADLVHAGEETAARLRDALDWPARVDAEIRRRVDALVTRGEFSLEEGERLLSKLLAVDRESLPGPEKIVEKILAERGIPTRQEVLALSEQIDDLLRQFDTQ
jgi:polyhydroxyalkanoate synthesis repressor PhaR